MDAVCMQYIKVGEQQLSTSPWHLSCNGNGYSAWATSSFNQPSLNGKSIAASKNVFIAKL